MDNQPSESRFKDVYNEIYGIDLVFRKDCWRLCGDAHCCHFSRYKSEAALGFHEIPLLPGEWDYLSSNGYIDQYENCRQLTFSVDLSVGTLAYESLRISTAGCPCSHNIRPTVCRLYPLLPVFSASEGLIGIDMQFTIFDVIEEALDLPRACRIEEVPLNEVVKFVEATRALGSEPVLVFHLMAYKLVKDTFRRCLLERIAVEGRPVDLQRRKADVFAAYQQDLVIGKLMDWSAVKAELDELGDGFKRLYGSSFALA